MGTWAYSIGFSHSAGLAEFGKMVVEGKTKLSDRKALLAMYGKFSPGAKWNGSAYIDAATKKPMRNFFLMYQDTYVLGKGYLGATKVTVPEKYLRIQMNTTK